MHALSNACPSVHTLKQLIELGKGGGKAYPFEVSSDWHHAKAEIVSFEAEELFGIKLRAWLQRNKNRALFDLNEGLIQLDLDRDKLLACFHHYLTLDGNPITRANAEERMLPPPGLDPLDSPQFARFFANYWVAQANLPWALQKFDRAD